MKIWITIPTWNRKKTAETIIPITYKHKKDHFLHITDDYSTEYNAFELFKNHADQIERPPKKLGVQLLRCWEFRKFLETDYDLIYMTDSDALHDPNFTDRLLELYDVTKHPVCIYNTNWHIRATINYNEKYNFYWRRTMPGVSQLYDRSMVEKIVKELDKRGDPVYAWDYRVLEYLGMKSATSKTSYMQHFGGPGSIHNKTLTSDTALEPTEYLKSMWNPILKQITKR